MVTTHISWYICRIAEKKPKHRTKHRKQKTDIVKKEIKVALYCSVLCKKRKGLKLKLIGSKSTKDFFVILILQSSWQVKFAKLSKMHF